MTAFLIGLSAATSADATSLPRPHVSNASKTRFAGTTIIQSINKDRFLQARIVLEEAAEETNGVVHIVGAACLSAAVH